MYNVEILDTAGEEDFQNMMDMWISFGDGFLLVFAINDKNTFDAVKAKYSRILKGKHGVKCPILLVGNKVDLEKDRKVTKETAENLATEYGMNFYESSALNGYNIEKIFFDLCTFVSQKIDKGEYNLDDPSVGVSKSDIEEGLEINKNLTFNNKKKNNNSNKCC